MTCGAEKDRLSIPAMALMGRDSHYHRINHRPALCTEPAPSHQGFGQARRWGAIPTAGRLSLNGVVPNAFLGPVEADGAAAGYRVVDRVLIRWSRTTRTGKGRPERTAQIS